MKQRITERPECSEFEQKHAGDSLSLKAKKWMAQGVKFALRALLMRPATWRWLMVNLPDYWDKAVKVFQAVTAWFFDSN